MAASTRTKQETNGCSKNTAGLGGVDGDWGSRWRRIGSAAAGMRCCLLLPGDRGSVRRRRPGQLAE